MWRWSHPAVVHGASRVNRPCTCPLPTDTHDCCNNHYLSKVPLSDVVDLRPQARRQHDQPAEERWERTALQRAGPARDRHAIGASTAALATPKHETTTRAQRDSSARQDERKWTRGQAPACALLFRSEACEDTSLPLKYWVRALCALEAGEQARRAARADRARTGYGGGGWPSTCWC